MVQPITTVQWLRRVLFQPIAGVLLLAWLLYGVGLFQTQLRDQQARIETIGQLMAVLVGHWGDLEPTGQHGVILRQLLQAGDVPQVHYLPLGATLQVPASSPSLWQQVIEGQAQHRYIPVYRHNNGHDLVGYLDFGFSVRPVWQAFLVDQLQLLLVVLVVLALLWGWMGVWGRWQSHGLEHLAQIAGLIRQGVPVQGLRRPRVLKDAQQLENDLFEIQAQLTSQQQQLAEARAALTEKDRHMAHMAQEGQRFRSMINHELKTPLNAIWGGIQLLQHDQHLSDAQRDSVKLIEYGSRTLGQFLDQVLLMVQLEQGRLAPDIAAVSPLELLDAQVQWARQQLSAAQQDRVVVRLQAEHDQVRLQVDAGRVSQILQELLKNAIHFTPQGTITVHSQLLQAAEQPVRWRLQVSDTGVGMDETTRLQCTRPFFQGEMQQLAPPERLGVGLSIAVQLIEVLQGHWQLDSQLGQGTTVTVELPVRVDCLSRWPSLKGKRLLMCSSIHHWPLHSLLSAEGAEVCWFVGMEDLVAQCDNLHPDLVLLQGGEQGDWLLQRVQAVRARSLQQDLRLAMVVPGLSTRQQQAWLQAGVDWFVSDHWTAEQMLDHLERWLR